MQCDPLVNCTSCGSVSSVQFMNSSSHCFHRRLCLLFHIISPSIMSFHQRCDMICDWRITSNMTSHHRDPNRKLPAGYRAPSLQCTSYLHVGVHCGASYHFHHIVWYRAFSLCYVHAMHVFNVRASSSPLGYPCAKFCFCCAPTAELARGEKSRTQSLTHSPSLLDVPGTEAFASE